MRRMMSLFMPMMVPRPRRETGESRSHAGVSFVTRRQFRKDRRLDHRQHRAAGSADDAGHLAGADDDQVGLERAGVGDEALGDAAADDELAGLAARAELGGQPRLELAD